MWHRLFALSSALMWPFWRIFEAEGGENWAWRLHLWIAANAYREGELQRRREAQRG